MIEVSNLQMQRVAILENAFKIGYDQTMNELWSCEFTLPLDDPKVNECQPLYFIDLWDGEKYIGKFKIKPNQTVKNNSSNTIRFYCEHVLCTLMDDIMFDYNQTVNIPTNEVLQFILDKQTTKHWQLGQVDITRYFHYKWESENLLSALLSVTQPFTGQYMWTWDTSTYPFTLNLLRPSDEVKGEIRYGKNMRGITKDEDPSNLITRIYPRGRGEGVNQLGITEVNPTGLPYIEAEGRYITKYGIISYPWVDRRYENAESLYNSAKAILDEYKEPKLSYSVSVADLEILPEYKELEQLEMGSVVRIVDPDIGTVKQRIVKRSKADVTGKPWDLQLDIGHIQDDIATQQREVNRDIDTNKKYAQGSLSVDSQNYNDNCDQNHGAIIRFWLPSDIVNINEMKLSYETTGFRAYSGTTVSGGSTTSAAGGGGTSGPSSKTTSASGGGGTSSNGGGTTVTSSFEKPNFYLYTSIPLPYDYVEDHIHALEVVDELNHAHNVTVSSHSHSMPDHTHNIDHTHQLPTHTHENPAHSHGVKHEITVLNNLPTDITVKVDGNTVPTNSLNGDDIDIIPFLDKDSSGRISRGRWVEVTLTPSSLARINANVIGRYFVQSYIGGIY
ncbi:phage tail spike protein [Pseudalkalibacillus decolorationis]|uniref:phage tail spike protein n=1 Tax=Pseudalkalibacillus decolorationis TaxID=163879 RepID=UPI00214727FE|nr:phage tail spike protein [Pseudalkalibacillus decolorationis]